MKDQRIIPAGDPGLYRAPTAYTAQALPETLARLHHAISIARVKEFTLDFSRTTSAFEASMLPLVAIVDHYRSKQKTKFLLKLPNDDRIKRIFNEANWAHYIDPSRHDFKGGRSEAHCPAVKFASPKEHFDAVDRVLGIVLSATDIDRSVLKAMEWSLNEITDNVLNHAGKNIPGFIQATWFRNQRTMEFVVSDAGMGIAKSLGETDHMIALERAVQEGVTRNSETNQGNGLFGSYRIAANSHGTFNIFSGFSTLYLTDSGKVKIKPSRVPFKGTTVRWTMRTDAVDVLQKALVFKGRAIDTALDYMERVYEGKAGSISISMKGKFPSLGSRIAGKSAHTYIRNILFNTDVDGITLDFSGVSIISSSFADEVFGKLFVELGPMQFMGRIHFIQGNGEILNVINRAIVQRSGMKV